MSNKNTNSNKAKPLIELFAETAEIADVVTVDSGCYCHFNWDKIRNTSDNAILSVTWHDDEGEEARCTIIEEAFEPENHPSLKEGIFRLIDSDGDPTEIRFYRLELLRP
jgi:hypothetical protein